MSPKKQVLIRYPLPSLQRPPRRTSPCRRPVLLPVLLRVFASKKRIENELDGLKRRLRVQPTSQEDEDTFTAFIEDKTIDLDALKITPLQWWLVPEQRRRYPRLHRMAINILSIAPSSAEPEQQFSGARRTQSWDRLRLSPENLQRLECMGNWFARKLISSEEQLAMMVEAVEMDDEMNIGFDE
ncbi:hypothetical protein FOFC_02513 [Fusarium oxysporum]|nr:hypothetical protein FOFC_15746 [Fusarium oxysporum]KAI8416204.1 hypothetical protein FOFC_02513 [Fusarium oxysporum]